MCAPGKPNKLNDTKQPRKFRYTRLQAHVVVGYFGYVGADALHQGKQKCGRKY